LATAKKTKVGRCEKRKGGLEKKGDGEERNIQSIVIRKKRASRGCNQKLRGRK